MEQLYLIEFYIDRMKIYAERDEMTEEDRNKRLVFRINFGSPKKQLLIRENIIVENKEQDELITDKKCSWIRSIKTGTAMLFVTYPDSLIIMLRNNPVDIEVWNTDENESSDDFKQEIFVGCGKLIWDKHFVDAVKSTYDNPKVGEIHPPNLKVVVKIAAECCCKIIGEVRIIVRLSPLGPMVITDFQQNLNDPEYFNFKTDKYPGNIYQLNIYEGAGNELFGAAVANDPVLGDHVDKRTEVCTLLPDENPDDEPCARHRAKIERDHRIKTGKIKIGDIIGPCGNPNCKLAQRVRTYVRSLEAYKKIFGGWEAEVEKPNPRKVCGECICRNDKYHAEEWKKAPEMSKCEGCGGKAPKGETCQEQDDKFYGTGNTPPGGSIVDVSGARKC